MDCGVFAGCRICICVCVILTHSWVDFCDSLVDSLNSLDSVGAGESGLDSGMASVFGNSMSAVAAEWPFMAMS